MKDAASTKNGNHSSDSAAAQAAAVLSDTTSKIDAAMNDAKDRAFRADEWFRALSKQRPLALLGAALLCGFLFGKIVSKLGGAT